MPSLLLVRHARASLRGRGPDDIGRPLDERGVEQARALARSLAPLLREGTSRRTGATIHSSPARRCIETVTPLATALGVDVTVDAALFEETDPRTLEERIGEVTGPTVWSSHGDVIPSLLVRLARSGLDVGPDPRCQKASTWVIDVEDGVPRRARYLAPPA